MVIIQNILESVLLRRLMVVMSYRRKNKTDKEIEEMQNLTKPFIVSKKKVKIEKLKAVKEKFLHIQIKY